MPSPTAAPGRYPRQAITMLDDDLADRLERDALNEQKSKSAILRERIAAGAELHDVALEYGVSVPDLVTAARLHAIRQAASS